MKQLRYIMIEAYLDYRNNYLTVAKYAEHNGLTEGEAQALIETGRAIASHDHPEA